MLSKASWLLRASLCALVCALCGFACDRIPEQVLRDEQSRARHYRAAFENEHDENVQLRARLEKASANVPEQAACGSQSGPLPVSK